MKEIWKDIPNYEGLYQVSNLGRVKSLARKNWMKRNGCYRNVNEKILKQNLTGYKLNYYSVCLSKNGEFKSHKTHKLVAIVFLNHIPCGHKIVVDHINENSLDNRLINLQLLTNIENIRKYWKLKNTNLI